MPSASQQPLIIAVTAARPITKEERENIRREVQSQVPADAAVIVLSPGQSVSVLSMASHEVELLEQILAETKGMRADMAQQFDTITAGGAAIRTISEGQ